MSSKRLNGSGNTICFILSRIPIAVAQYLKMRFSSMTLSKRFLQFLHSNNNNKNCFIYLILKVPVSGQTLNDLFSEKHDYSFNFPLGLIKYIVITNLAYLEIWCSGSHCIP